MLVRLVCAVVNHRWSRHRYAGKPGEDQPEGTYLKCLRCGKIDEGSGLPPGPMAAGF